jgi:hypothetical protein
MLAASLSAADLHVVVMGDEFVGIVHPCKLYNILTIGTPFLYVGPKESHISEIAAQSNGRFRAYAATNGDVATVVERIQEEASHRPTGTRGQAPEIAAKFSRKALLPRLMKLLESQVELESQVAGQSKGSSHVSAAR